MVTRFDIDRSDGGLDLGCEPITLVVFLSQGFLALSDRVGFAYVPTTDPFSFQGDVTARCGNRYRI